LRCRSREPEADLPDSRFGTTDIFEDNPHIGNPKREEACDSRPVANHEMDDAVDITLHRRWKALPLMLISFWYLGNSPSWARQTLRLVDHGSSDEHGA
jgi:hypothetical protein